MIVHYVDSYAVADAFHVDMPFSVVGSRLIIGPGSFRFHGKYSLPETEYDFPATPPDVLNIYLARDSDGNAVLIVDEVMTNKVAFLFQGSPYTQIVRWAWSSKKELGSNILNVRRIRDSASVTIAVPGDS